MMAPPTHEYGVVTGDPAPEREDSTTILSVAGVSRSFGGVHAVDGVSFDVPAGTIHGLLGPKGAGKSTLMTLIAGSERADTGRIAFRGEDIHRLPDYRRARKGLVRAF